MMITKNDIQRIGDDFFTVGKIAILQKSTGNDVYDFNFRNFFDCKSVVSSVTDPVILHIGAIEDYAGIDLMLREMGTKLLINENEHLNCSTIERWYPRLKDKTPFTKVYDELPPVEELEKDFSFPVFIKGNRQTNRHSRKKSIIENADQYELLRDEWQKDEVLFWQKVAVREYVPLQVIDAESFPNMVPISYEFRFFYFEKKCMAYGPYWYMGKQYSLSKEELTEVLKLTDWAADRIGARFPAIDVAKTASGEWIIIEINDAQESGFVGVNPIELWTNVIKAAQNREWFSPEDFFGEGYVIMGQDPLQGKTIEEMISIKDQISSKQQLARLYAAVDNKYSWLASDMDELAEGSDEYIKVSAVVDAWKKLAHELKDRVMANAEEEGLLGALKENQGYIWRIIPFMEKYGIRNGRGWWVTMSLGEKYRKLIQKRIKIEEDIDYDTNPIIAQMVDLLSEDVDETIEYLHEECSGYELVWMSEIFDEVAERTKSKEFIQALRETSIKYLTAAKEYNLKFMIDSAEEYTK